MSEAPATSWAIWAWQAYRDGRLVEADTVQAQIDAAVKAERERIATMIEATAYTNNGAVRSLEPVSPALVGMDMHHATIAAAIRKEEQS